MFRNSVSNYPVYILIGITVWNFFSQTTAYAMGQFLWGGALMKRVYVPPSLFAVACVGNGLVNVGFSMIPLLFIMIVFRHPFHATWWFVPDAVVLQTAFTLGLTLLMSTLAVFFADVVDMFGLILQSWFDEPAPDDAVGPA